jgi:hypothetical protein
MDLSDTSLQVDGPPMHFTLFLFICEYRDTVLSIGMQHY